MMDRFAIEMLWLSIEMRVASRALRRLAKEFANHG